MSEDQNEAANGVEDGRFNFMDFLNNPQVNPQQIEAIRESCPFIVVTHSVIGFGFGGMMGLFFASLGSSSPETSLFMGDRNAVTGQLYASTRAQVAAVFKEMASRTWSSAKSFGKIAALFSASECVIESVQKLQLIQCV